MMRYIGWVANGMLLTGQFLVGNKQAAGFILIGVGEALWASKTWRMKQWDMLFICVVFGLLALRNYLMWTLQ